MTEINNWNGAFLPDDNEDDLFLDDPIDRANARAKARSEAYERSYVPLNRDPPTKPTNAQSEAAISKKIDDYLKQLGAITIRTNAGTWQDDTGHYIQGAKAGTSDKTVCLPKPQEGRYAVFCAIEVKTVTGVQSDAQKRYQQRVERLGGIYILARSAKDVQAALVKHFGIDQVVKWENDKR